MTTRFAAAATLPLAALLGFSLTAGVASAAPRHQPKAGVQFANKSTKGGYRALVSDGPGTGFGFHRLPTPYRVAAGIRHDRQAAAVRDTVETDALTSGGFRSGFLGDDVAASGRYANYGVFSGADGYGTPYFAGYYGPGGGDDLGPLGRTYD